MKSRQDAQAYIDDVELACEASGLDPVKTADLLRPLREQVDAYYNDDITTAVDKCLAALSHGLLRIGFKYDRYVRYKPCGGAPIGFNDVLELFAHEDTMPGTDVRVIVESIVEVTPPTPETADAGTGTGTGTAGEAAETYYESDVVDELIELYASQAPIVRAGLGLIASHGNSVAILPAIETMFGGAELVAAPSTDDIKHDIYTERHYADLIRCRSLSLEIYE